MKLTKQEFAFVERRSTLARSWPIVGSICLAVVFALVVWLWLSRPLLINPWAVFSGLEAGSIPESTTILMAAMLPIVVLGCLLVVLVLLAFCFLAFSNERKHVELIHRLSGVHGSPAEKAEDQSSA